MGGLQDTEQHLVRDRVAAEAVADVAAFTHDLQYGLALGGVVAGGGGAGGLSCFCHCGRALFVVACLVSQVFLVGGPGVQVVGVLYEFGVAVAGCGDGGDGGRRLRRLGLCGLRGGGL